MINLAITSAEELGHNYIGSEHLLLGILKEDAGLGAQALRESGVQTEDVEKLIKENIGVGEPTRLTPDDFTPRFPMITLPSGAGEMKLSCFSAVIPVSGWNQCVK